MCRITAAVTVLLTATLAGCRVDYGDVAGAGGGGGDFLTTGRTLSFFDVHQVDPRSEDSAGPQFVVAADLNQDGLMDLVSAWNQSQPVQIHLQHRTTAGGISFETLTLAGSIPTVAVAGLAVADFDQDLRPDIAVLIKESLLTGAACLDSEQPEEGLRGLVLLYMGPTHVSQVNRALAWEEVRVEASFLQGAGEATGAPELGGFTSMAVGDMDLDGDPDIVVAWNSGCGGGIMDAVLFTNNGPGAVRDGSWTGERISDEFPKGTMIKDVAIGDIDLDGDMDIVATYPDAQTMNIRWYRNPTLDVPDDYHFSGAGWQVGTVAQIATGADSVELGDIDGDGIIDVVARSAGGNVIQWLKGPDGPTTAPLRAIPWQVYTLAEFKERTPQAIALGDLNFDGKLDLVASAGGGLIWLDSKPAPSEYDQWTEQLILDEPSEPPPAQVGGGATQSLDGAQMELTLTLANNEPPPDTSTYINTLLIVDLDGDGANDIVTTLDRSGLSGLTNDAIAWFRNLRNPPL
jgi:hypothetical protein